MTGDTEQRIYVNVTLCIQLRDEMDGKMSLRLVD